ncbi:L10-interacting MYB domain-containing protein-like [Bidens hawaiensis]|uniref:L10-interacting MYB domain-containing protein-like n=1 Tax=Bidens hawaiensis TaxID=980011 RepID=UPI00404B8317
MVRINWKQEGVEKTFLEACIHELTVNGREGGNLKTLSWKNISEKLKMQHNFIVEQKQMRNRYDYLKGRFSAWRKLKNKTGNIYNAVTNMFNLSEEEWQLKMKTNKYVEALRTMPLAYPELCTQLFEGSTSNGFESWGPSSTLPHPFEEVLDNTSNGLEDVDLTAIGAPTVSVNDDSPVQPKKGG